MNKTLYQLAYRNIYQYKKHYVHISIIILMLVVGMITYIMTWDNYYEVQKSYNQDHYGQWYFMADFDDRKDILDKYIETLNTPVEYGYDYVQGYYQEQYQIAHVTDNIYELCHLSLKEGTYPTKNNEIAISEDMSLAEKLKVGDQIEFSIDSKTLQKYTIVGIVQNSKPFVKNVVTEEKDEISFPDVYTSIDNIGQLKIIANQELNITDEILGFSYHETDYYFENVLVNVNGYSAGSMGDYKYTTQQTIVFVEVICLSVLGLSMIMSTSLKRRLQEFALLRGIGMTTRQLFLMVLYEMLYLVIILMSIGMILSIGLTYIIMLYYQTKLGYFVCHYSIIKIIIYSFLLTIIILLSFIYPIFSSVKKSLTGTFEGKEFQYIQVRYRKLHYQKTWRLALREIKVHKKLSLSLLIILSGLIVSYTHYEMKDMIGHSWNENFYQVTTEQEDMEKIKALNLPHTIIVKYKMVESDGNLLVVGTMDNKNFQIVGIISDEFISDNTLAIPLVDIYVSPKVYNQFDHQKEEYNVRIFYNTLIEKEKIKYLVEREIDSPLSISNALVENDQTSARQEMNEYVVMILGLICFVFCYFLNKNYVFNHYQDYTIYRLVGMTKKDLLVKEFFKAFFMSSFVFMIQMFWIMMTNIYYGRSDIPLISIGVCYAILLLALSIVYCLPLYGILKKDYAKSLK